jgi:eukaryotic translation initiation factor 2C
VRATLGVSYASPAYYADRLCERGRAYLRDFFAPSPSTRDKWDKRKNELEAHARSLRAQPQNWPRVAQSQKTKALKDAEKAERQKEKDDREWALAQVKEEIKKAINEAWDVSAYDRLCAAQRDRLRQTMY